MILRVDSTSVLLERTGYANNITQMDGVEYDNQKRNAIIIYSQTSKKIKLFT